MLQKTEAWYATPVMLTVWLACRSNCGSRFGSRLRFLACALLSSRICPSPISGARHGHCSQVRSALTLIPLIETCRWGGRRQEGRVRQYS